MSRVKAKRGRHGRDHGHAEPGEDRWIEPEAVRCRLLVALAANDDPAGLLGLDAVAGFVLAALDAETARPAVVQAHAAGRAVFLVDRPDLVAATGADGVLLNRPAEVRAARALLPADSLIGAACGMTRHDAMVAGEDGADYVLFGTVGAPQAGGIDALARHVAWWSEVAVLPVVAAGRFSPDDVGKLALAGADFILPADAGDLEGLSALATALPAR